MNAQYAVAITTWRYPPPYDCYDMTGTDPAGARSYDILIRQETS